MLRKLPFLIALLLAIPAHAHIGSPDTFVQATAGPYSFLIAAHPPATYPGALELDLRFNPDDHIASATAALDSASPTPIRIFDAGTATATLWLPTPAAHTIHIAIQGNGQGSTYDLALPSSPQITQPSINGRWHSTLLVLCLALISGAVVLAARKRKYIGYAGLMASAGLALALISAHYTRTPPPSTTLLANLSPDGKLDFTLTNPSENFANLVPDDGKLMHLFLIRQPNDDVFLHLHPSQLSPGHFSVPLPAMPPGTYTLFTDFYVSPTANGQDARSETDIETLTLPAQFHPAAVNPDDTIAVLPPANSAAQSFSAASQLTVTSTTAPGGLITYSARLPDNYTLTLTGPADLHPFSPNLFQVTLLDPTGHPPANMTTYLGMPAHAVVLRSDNGVFAHIHPGGTLPMLSSASTMNMSMPMDMPMPTVSNTATIPYGFPTPGRYRIFVQMKHGAIVETAAFDLTVN